MAKFDAPIILTGQKKSIVAVAQKTLRAIYPSYITPTRR